jgi:hypothetical protein
LIEPNRLDILRFLRDGGEIDLDRIDVNGKELETRGLIDLKHETPWDSSSKILRYFQGTRVITSD